MNNEDYVSLEVARLLKEKSYPDPKGFAPTLYEAQKWLREKHNIHIDVRCTAYCKPLNRCDYMCEVFALSDHIFCDTKVSHKYEEALNEGILKALQII